MNELVDRTKIQQYSIKNTSPQMPLEAKYVYAFVDALLNSTSVKDVYDILSEELQDGDTFVIFNSFFIKAKNVNKEPYRSIIAYSMLKKDFRLFELISASMFTGSVMEYHGSDLYAETAFNTDEIPTKFTDSGIFTDMGEGVILIGFKNWYCPDPLPDGTGSEYQTMEELNHALDDFDNIITLTKPARVQILLFFVRYMYLSGDASTIESCGIDRNDENFLCPFGDPISMNILNNMSEQELKNLYKEVSMYDYTYNLDRGIDVERTVRTEPGFVRYDYDFRCMASSSSEESEEKDMIWGTIKILSNAGSKSYARKFEYKEDEQYFEKYNPIMLRINDNDPDGPCLALELEYSGSGDPTTDDNPDHWTGNYGALFYTRDRI